MKKNILYLLLTFTLTSFAGNQIDSLNELSEHYRNSDVEKALGYAEEALKMSQKNNLQDKTAQSMNNIAGVYCNKGDYVNALEYYTEALDIYKKIKNKKGIAKTKNNLGVLTLINQAFFLQF